jgi:surface antigen
LTHTLVLAGATLVPLLSTINRNHADTLYGAGYASSATPPIGSSRVDEVTVSAGGYIMKVNPPSVDIPARRSVTYYTIRPGETIAKIAGQFGLTENTLRWANNIKDLTTVRAGLKLMVPPVNGVLVKVETGMQVKDLAAKFHIKVEDVIDFNLIRNPENLVSGTMLMLPDAVGPPLDEPQTVVSRAGNAVQWNRIQNQTVIYYGPVANDGGKFPYGWCTWWVAHKRYVPWNGNAWEWFYQAQQFGFKVGQTPAVGAIMVTGINWTSPLGHVAYVEQVNADGSFTVSEMNWGRWGVMDFRTLKSTQGIDLLGFIY